MACVPRDETHCPTVTNSTLPTASRTKSLSSTTGMNPGVAQACPSEVNFPQRGRDLQGIVHGRVVQQAAVQHILFSAGVLTKQNVYRVTARDARPRGVSCMRFDVRTKGRGTGGARLAAGREGQLVGVGAVLTGVPRSVEPHLRADAAARMTGSTCGLRLHLRFLTDQHRRLVAPRGTTAAAGLAPGEVFPDNDSMGVGHEHLEAGLHRVLEAGQAAVAGQRQPCRHVRTHKVAGAHRLHVHMYPHVLVCASSSRRTPLTITISILDTNEMPEASSARAPCFYARCMSSGQAGIAATCLLV